MTLCSEAIVQGRRADHATSTECETPFLLVTARNQGRLWQGTSPTLPLVLRVRGG